MVIFGGMGFIGLYLAEYFAKRKYHVVLVSRQPRRRYKLLSEKYGDLLAFYPMDVLRNDESLDHFFDVDVAINLIGLL